MHGLRYLAPGGGLKHWLGLGFGMGLGFELVREGLPIVALLVLLGMLTHPALTFALLGGIVGVSVLWHNRHKLRESQETKRKREARARWSGVK